MYEIPLTKVVGRLAAVTGLAAGLMSAGGGIAAADEELDPPVNIMNTSLEPNCMNITWQHVDLQNVDHFTVDRIAPPKFKEFTRIPAPQLQHYSCGMEGGTEFVVQVCAVYGPADTDPKECTGELHFGTPPPVGEGTLPPVGEMEKQPPQGPLPKPPVKPNPPGTTEFGVEWGWKGTSDGHTYDYFNLAVAGPGGREMKHDSEGNWGWQLITGLKPGTEYSVMVEGCDIDPMPYTNDNCSGWSPAVKVTTKPYPLHSGADTCLPRFVWREAFKGDTVCVPPPRRDTVKADNATASSRLNEGGNCTPGVNCTFTTSDICKQGFVWREIRPEDHVCVSPQERDLVQQENAMANQRRAAPR